MQHISVTFCNKNAVNTSQQMAIELLHVNHQLLSSDHTFFFIEEVMLAEENKNPGPSALDGKSTGIFVFPAIAVHPILVHAGRYALKNVCYYFFHCGSALDWHTLFKIQT